jgi:hypothetical protein
MRVKLIGERESWLDLDVEAPAGMETKSHLTAWRARRRGTLVLLKLVQGSGVWNEDGRLLAFFRKVADLEVSDGRLVLLSNEFGPCTGGARGVRHSIKESTTPLQVTDGQSVGVAQVLDLCVPTGGANYLDISAAARMGLASWLDQSEWGYVLFNLDSKLQLGTGPTWKKPTIAPPTFSPDGRFVVSCQHERAAWWNDETDDPSEVPSPGGRRRLGTVSTHAVSTGEIRETELFVDLPAGWLPDRPYNSEWYRVWGPEFIDEGSLRVWLPDGTSETLALPLPESIVLSRPLSNQRTWLEP